MRMLYLIVVTCVFSYFLLLFKGDKEVNIDAAEPALGKARIDEPATQVTLEARSEENVHVIVQPGVGANSPGDEDRQDTARLYRWKGPDNITVISTEPPPQGIDAATFLYSNRAASGNDSMEITRHSAENSNKVMNGPSFRDDPLQVYTPDGLKEFIEYSKEIGEKIEVRGKELEELVELL